MSVSNILHAPKLITLYNITIYLYYNIFKDKHYQKMYKSIPNILNILKYNITIYLYFNTLKEQYCKTMSMSIINN